MDDMTPLYTVSYVEGAPTSAAEVATLLRRRAEAARDTAGPSRVELLERVDRSHHFAILGVWSDQGAFDTHRAAPAAADVDARLTPLLTGPVDERAHHAFDVESDPAVVPPEALYVVTHVDVIPSRKDDGAAALVELARASRGDAGHVRFDVLQQTTRANHFTVVEVWASRRDFDAHVMAAHTRRFRGQLAPMSGALYDERLYRSVG